MAPASSQFANLLHCTSHRHLGNEHHCTSYCHSQEFDLVTRGHLALVPVDSEFEYLFDKLGDRLKYSLSRLATGDKHVAIIGKSTETQSAILQFRIELV